MTKSSSNDINTLKRRLRHLCEENDRLKKTNTELSLRLDAKRYKLVNFVVDNSYRVTRKIKKDKKKQIKNSTSSEKFKAIVQQRHFVKNKVDIININFFDWDGKIIYKGGAERYVYDLACLLKKMGYNVRILQCSNKPFKKSFRNIEVVGIGTGYPNDIVKTSLAYNKICSDCEFIIASPLDLACRITDIPTIGINHGINFDGNWNHYNREIGPVRHDEHIAALNNVDYCVCVDTNFINWTRTQDYNLSLKEYYIPNYFNKNQFKVIKKRKNKDKIVFVYPRRIYSARGYDITIDAFREIFKKYKNKAIINFVGQIDNEEARKKLTKFKKDFPKNVFHNEYNMQDMSKAYEDADVVLIPTRYCEGTSLSCIEGMASGSAIIATNVGGLPNLVFDGYNGRLISPTAEELTNAIEEMIVNSDLRNQFAKHSKEIATASLEKNIWDERWKKIFQKY